jgi:hypothetical protein
MIRTTYFVTDFVVMIAQLVQVSPLSKSCKARVETSVIVHRKCNFLVGLGSRSTKDSYEPL